MGALHGLEVKHGRGSISSWTTALPSADSNMHNLSQQLLDSIALSSLHKQMKESGVSVWRGEGQDDSASQEESASSFGASPPWSALDLRGQPRKLQVACAHILSSTVRLARR
eukprot:1904412-Amphidinium_carterae.1